jgi:hypothetical protein
MMTEKKTFADWMRGFVHVHKADTFSCCQVCRDLGMMEYRKIVSEIIEHNRTKWKL